MKHTLTPQRYLILLAVMLFDAWLLYLFFSRVREVSETSPTLSQTS